MKVIMEIDIDLEESGLDEDEVKDNILDFTRDLLTYGAEEQELSLTLKEVSYDA